MAFRTEELLVEKALESQYIKGLINQPSELTSYWDIEVEGLFGIPDLVIFYTNPSAAWNERFVTLAFEIKLSKWERALIQAYRYKSFANKSYVLIDHTHINPPRSNLTRFKKANVGLLSIDDSGVITPFFEPKYGKPFSKVIEEEFLGIVFKQEYIFSPLYFDQNGFREVALR